MTEEVQVNQTPVFEKPINSFLVTEEIFFMAYCVSEDYLNAFMNKKFFIQKLRLIFVPLQKNPSGKPLEKRLIKKIFNQP